MKNANGDSRNRYISSDELVGRRGASDNGKSRRHSAYENKGANRYNSRDLADGESYNTAGSYEAFDEDGNFIGIMCSDGVLRGRPSATPNPPKLTIFDEDEEPLPQKKFVGAQSSAPTHENDESGEAEPEDEVVLFGDDKDNYYRGYDEGYDDETAEADNEVDSYTEYPEAAGATYGHSKYDEYDEYDESDSYGEDEEYDEYVSSVDERDDSNTGYYDVSSRREENSERQSVASVVAGIFSTVGNAVRDIWTTVCQMLRRIDPATKKKVLIGAGGTVALGLIVWLIVSLTSNSGYTNAKYFTYATNADGTLVIMSYTGDSATVNIPPKISGSEVTAIGDGAFSGSSAQIITVPEGVTDIASNAFSGCERLSEVNLPASVVTIGSAFDSSPNLAAINIAEGNESFVSFDGVLYNADASSLIRCPEGKTETVTLPDSCVTIEAGAFRNCAVLTEAVLNDGLQRIGGSAFAGCSSIDIAGLPESLVFIGTSAFKDCEMLKSINVIPGSVEFISANTFEGSGLQALSIREGVTAIDAEAFLNCTLLRTVSIPASMETIDISSFGGCSSLVSIGVSEDNKSYSSISGVLFSKNPVSLVHVPASFSGALTLPNGMTEISVGAFEGCEGLTDITIPESVKTIGDNAFAGCSSLESIILPSSVTKIGESAFAGSGLKSLNTGSGVTSIENNAFVSCSDLGSVILGTKLSTIGDNAFSGCVSLKSLSFPDSLTKIGAYAFYSCPIAELSFGDKLSSIGEHAFDGSSKLTKASFTSAETSFGESCFGSATADFVIYGNYDSSAESYAGMSNFDFKPIGGEDFTFTKNSDKTVSVTGYTGKEVALVIPETIGGYKVTSISGISGSSITSIEIPSGVNSISNEFLSGLTGLTSISVSTSNTSYSSSDGLLYNKNGSRLIFCPRAKTGAINVSGGTKTIGASAFAGCKISSVSLPSALTAIESSAFSGCTSLSAISIPSGVSVISEKAFSGCTSLNSVQLPDTLEKIGDQAFANCSSLKDITIGKSVSSIASNAFSGCSGLTVRGVEDSTAHHFAKASGFDFVAIEDTVG